jgi:hypothetical protein
MDLSLSGASIKLFSKAVLSLSKISACASRGPCAARCARARRVASSTRRAGALAHAPPCRRRHHSTGSRRLRGGAACAAAARLSPCLLAPRRLRRARGAAAQLTLRAINSSESAYFAVRVSADCFDAFRVDALVQTAVYAKARTRACLPAAPAPAPDSRAR